MISEKVIARIILILITIVFGSFFYKCQAQDDESYRAKIYVGYSNLQPEYNSSIRGVTAELTPTLYKYENVRLEATASFSRHFKEGGNNSQFLFGPRVSVELGKTNLVPFARLLFGVTRVYQTNIYTTEIGGGLDVNLGRFYVTPIVFGRQNINGSYPITANRIGAGAGFKF